jgi:putative MATE family efflux protein
LESGTESRNQQTPVNGQNGSNGHTTDGQSEPVLLQATTKTTTQPDTPDIHNGAANGVTPDPDRSLEADRDALLAGGGNNNRGGWRNGRPGGPGGPGGGGPGRPGGPGGPGPNGPRRPWQGRDLLNGSIPKNLWGMAWPQSIEGVLRVVDQMLDLIWAGFLGTAHIAGIGTAQQVTQMAWTARQGVDTANRAMVSRAIGMGNVALAKLTVYQAATVTAIFWVVIATLGIILTKPILQLLGVPDDVVDKAVPYMRVQFLGQGFMSFQQLAGQTLIASGDPITPMRAHIVSRVIHGFCSPLFIFGSSGLGLSFLGIPGMGIAGAPLAAATGNATALVICSRALLTGRTRLHLKLSEYRIDRKLIWNIIRIGAPAAVNGAERSVAQLLLLSMVTPFGSNAIAAFTLTRRVEMFANLGSQGFGQASGVIVGQNLGAGNLRRAKQTIYWALGYVITVKTTLTLLLFAFPEAFLSLFTRDPELLELGATWVRIGCIGHLATGFGNIFQQTFMTAGATMWPMFVTLVALWCIELPSAYFLSTQTSLGALGVAWGVSIAAWARPAMNIPYFLSDRWTRARVFSDATLAEMQAAQSPI